MADPQKALETQLANIEKKTGKKLAQLHSAISKSGLAKHGEIRSWLIETFELGYGDANTLAHSALNRAAEGGGGDALAEIYSGNKAALRSIHDKVMETITGFGAFEVAPKKGYVSLRRKKQFAMLGPKASDRVELGINLKDDVASARIVAQKPGGMCQYIVKLTSVKDFDKPVISALKKAFDAAG